MTSAAGIPHTVTVAVRAEVPDAHGPMVLGLATRLSEVSGRMIVSPMVSQSYLNGSSAGSYRGSV